MKPVRDMQRRGRTVPARGAGDGSGRGPDASTLEVTAVRVVQATDADEAWPGATGPNGTPTGAGDATADTASDWLPGIRDEHEDDGWTAKWLDRPTWDHTVTPNVIKRTGARPPRRRR